jgi:hypothetical protein
MTALVRNEGSKMFGEAKKRMKSVVCAGIVTLALAAGYREVRAESHENYFPLNVGNSWTYIDCNESSTKTFTIIGTEEINGHTYYKFDDYVRVCGFPGCDSETCVPEDTDMLFRYEPNKDKVLQYRSSTNEDLVRYDFSGNMWPDGYGNQLIETGVSCTVPAGQFNNCCIFEFAMTVDCGEFYETLAPGVGNVRFIEGSVTTETFELQSYTIYPVGDLNHDGIVNLLDFVVLANYWLQDEPLADIAPDGGDGWVNVLDLSMLADHWLERVNQQPEVYVTSPPDGFEDTSKTNEIVVGTISGFAGSWSED